MRVARLGVGLVLAMLLAAGCLDPSPTPGSPDSTADLTLPGAVLHTSMGDVAWVFYPEAAPQTVAHISDLIRSHYYDGKGFGRVVPGHVIQQVERDGGTLTDDKATVPLEAPQGFHFSAGAVGIARGEDPDSGGPEFFVMDYATSHLDGNYTVFAQVVEGLDVVHRIARVPAVAFPSPAQLLTDRMAVQPVTISTAELRDVTLPAKEAARLPLQVARNVRAGDYRHSLEWPHDLAAGRSADLTWYVRPYNETASLDTTLLTLSIDGLAVPFTPQPGLPDILAFHWTPGTSGMHAATLALDRNALATLTIEVA
ncbi:MAG TPA: peptidylprolyl isomerase [Candidatus Thermoplasmatota archaeon]|nr:peptidylprolyl isomerase [Candidatus Thermoplasmatota archaeon]